MLTNARTLSTVTLLFLLAGAASDALAAGGTPQPTPMPAPTPVPAPAGPTPTWVITVPVKLASIPVKYPRFAVQCSVTSSVHPSGNAAFPLPTVDIVGEGRQDWPLDSNGAFSGSMAVKVFLNRGYNIGSASGGSYSCELWLVEANNVAHHVGPPEEQSLRPQDGTVFVPAVKGAVP